ncbi:hypothetical protein [Chondrinema litorale]|uniref:hypothetical protein n=1 Tax=Chondrinema litorale TaxID=2994555 RepID=UPI002543EA5D|nr:hypothetical protein [Chondrinema litorale]UZR98319.1 hypothetical protein OQ292_30440 [Chondrinema litorale]
MLKKGFLKPEISIDNIGKKRFWTGIVIGIIFSIILSLFFNYSREAFRFLTYSRDLYIPTKSETRFYNLYFASLATVLAFGLTIIYWFVGKNTYIKKRFLKSFAISNARFVIIVVLLMFARLGASISIIYASLIEPLNFIYEYWIFSFLIPLLIFYSYWNSISLFLRVNSWVYISAFCCVLVAFYLYSTTSVDTQILTNTYKNQHKERLTFIDETFEGAKIHEVYFDDRTKATLKNRYNEETYRLVRNLQSAFNKKTKVSIDTLLLEKIVIHNLHLKNRDISLDDKSENWSFAYPEQIYHQLLLQDSTSAESQILIDILKEEIALFNPPEYSYPYTHEFTSYEYERINYFNILKNHTPTIKSRLVLIVQKLKDDSKFNHFHDQLPDMEFSISESENYVESLID